MVEWWNTVVVSTNGNLLLSYAVGGFFIGAFLGYIQSKVDEFRSDFYRVPDNLTIDDMETGQGELPLVMDKTDAARKVS